MVCMNIPIVLICLVDIVCLLGCEASNICPLSSTDCSQHGVSCTISADDGCLLASQFDKVTEDIPGPVTSYNMVTHYLDPHWDTPKSNVITSWQLPGYGTHVYVTGFEVRITSADDPNPICLIFNISQPFPSDIALEHYVYTLNCSSMSMGQYNTSVTSLPLPSSQPSATHTSILRVLGDTLQPCQGGMSCWTTDVIVYLHVCDDILNVTFRVAPQVEAFEYYLVTLTETDSLSTDISVNASHENGLVYTSTLVNISEFTLPLIKREILVRPMGSVCDGNRCVISSTLAFDIHPPSKQTCSQLVHEPNEDNEKISTGALVGLIIGCIVLAGLVTTLIVTMLTLNRKGDNPNHTQSSSESGTEEVQSNASTRSLIHNRLKKLGQRISTWSTRRRITAPRREPPERKSTYVMYSNDNAFHQNVVGTLCEYLKVVCACDVIYDREYQHEISDKVLWIEGCIERSDYILVINSEGSYWKTRLHQMSRVYVATDCDSGLGDMFTPAYSLLLADMSERLRQKIILAHFSYTQPTFRRLQIPNDRDMRNFQLMKDIEHVYAYIYGCYGVQNNIDDLSYSDASDEGKALYQSIENAQSFISSNPDWFHNAYSCLRTTEPGNNPQYYRTGSLGNVGLELPRSQCDSPSSLDQVTVQTGHTQAGNIELIRLHSISSEQPRTDRNSYRRPKSIDDVTTMDGSLMGDIVEDINMNPWSSDFNSTET